MEWHYQKRQTGERQGPVSTQVVSAKITSGELGFEDVAWRVGLAQWMPLGSLPEFAAHFKAARPVQAVAAPAPVATAQPATVGYYTPRTDAPARVQANLAKYAPPTGPTGEWPLSDAHIAQLAESVRYRKRILAGFSISRLFAVICGIGVLGAIIALIAMLTSSRVRADDVIGAGVTLGVQFIFLVIYFLIGNAIKYCKIWGSLVLSILVTLGTLGATGGMGFAAMTARPIDQVPFIVFTAIALLIGGLLTFVSWRSFASTPKYLATHVWCQEALAVSEKTR